jgi:hypothetical protein
MTATAITMLTSTENGYLTDTGNNIMQVLNDTRSMHSLYCYLKNNKLFEKYEAIERNQEHYLYQIPVSVWTELTGLVPEWFFRVTLDDGSLFYDSFFDADYKEYDEPDRYIYLSLNQKPPSQVKTNIMDLLNSTHSAGRVIDFFRENKFFVEHDESNDHLTSYTIPEDVWEQYTDIPIETVDLLPYTLDGAIVTSRYSNGYDEFNRYVIVCLSA